MKKKLLFTLLSILIIGFLIPQNLKMPVKDATKHDYNNDSFWYYPWGKSVTHKGVDVFAKKRTSIYSATNGLVLFSGEVPIGGKIVLVLGPKWRLHYYAHLNDLNTSLLPFVSKKSKIGTVGTTGNAAGKTPHLHYSIVTIIPYFWRIDSDKQGWKKMFYLNPIEYFEN
ncbi:MULTISPECIES: M23 family metallopeptidase [Aequorivita]|uniref:M23 family metallopeptidase n=1 Tax=Aequorivita TaxID=153265 RepID=UPI001C88424F|nr:MULTISPECIES: M23 family metallopeptidase [Aequorivita]